ncbi:BON domain-containing protein [Janthinobacterium sp. 17J80-10]|uniref:BON domain-containing protein n=1 Tax=Janthinobacterium sp. 17J80-10 TaxID=2497863 RepID=UPI0010059F56|nr:BON domain-containing protein [Janthinobacterium sp. 17J80-10]QAU33693.1 BON domain-containing protein [Janthinobacterium sp. 17J80-10]
MKKFLACLSIVFAMGLAACTPTKTSRGTGEVIDDAALTSRVKTEIAKNAGMGEAAAINVDTYRGVVSLAGFVDNEEQARKAVEIASKVSGVTSVKNNLQIKPRNK